MKTKDSSLFEDNSKSYNKQDTKILNDLEMDSYNINKSNHFSTDNQTSNIQRKRKSRLNKTKHKKVEKHYFSIKYTIFLASIWIIFFAAFIVGFIVHYDVKNSSVTASSIIWTFSGIDFIFSIIFTYLYVKATKAKTNEELHKYLRLIPI